MTPLGSGEQRVIGECLNRKFALLWSGKVDLVNVLKLNNLDVEASFKCILDVVFL